MVPVPANTFTETFAVSAVNASGLPVASSVMELVLGSSVITDLIFESGDTPIAFTERTLYRYSVLAKSPVTFLSVPITDRFVYNGNDGLKLLSANETSSLYSVTLSTAPQL